MSLSHPTHSHSRAPSRIFLAWCGLLVLCLLPANATDYLFTHVAGPDGGPGNADGPPAIGRLNTPLSLSRDATGNLYVGDNGNRTLRRVAPDGTLSTLRAGSQPLHFIGPTHTAVDPQGRLYVSDTYTQIIYRIEDDGTASRWAGNSYQPFIQGHREIGRHFDGDRTAAYFHRQTAIAFDPNGVLYVADTGNHVIRRISPEGVVTTLAGSAHNPGGADGPGPEARFEFPASLAVDAAGQLHVGELATVRRVTPTGYVTTLAGQAGQRGSVDGSGPEARFSLPRVAVAPNGDVIVADSANHTLRRITPAGHVTTFAGSPGESGAQDGPGPMARFTSPTAVTVAPDGTIHVADSESDAIRRVGADGQVSTFAGRMGGFGHRDGTGTAALFHEPWGITLDAAGSLYVADLRNRAVRRISPAGEVTTVPGQGGALRGGFGSSMQGPSAIALDAAGRLVVAPAARDTVLKSLVDGGLLDMAGQPLTPGDTTPRGAFGRYTYLIGLAVHPQTGETYVADQATSGIWIFSLDGQLRRFEITSAEVEMRGPNGLAFDRSGNLYIADRTIHAILRITPSGILTVLAGSPGEWGHADGRGREARFAGPCGVTVDDNGHVFVADTGSSTLRRITPDGVVTTIAGQFGIYGSANGIGSAAHFFAPHAITLGPDGSLYIAEEGNGAIRRGRPLGPPVIVTHPASRSVTTGASLTLSVTAHAFPEPRYQWSRNGQQIAGATGPSLTLHPVGPEHTGSYTVTVANERGSVTSDAALVTLTAPPPTGTPTGGGGGGSPSWLGTLALALALLLARRSRTNTATRAA